MTRGSAIPDWRKERVERHDVHDHGREQRERERHVSSGEEQSAAKDLGHLHEYEEVSRCRHGSGENRPTARSSGALG